MASQWINMPCDTSTDLTDADFVNQFLEAWKERYYAINDGAPFYEFKLQAGDLFTLGSIHSFLIKQCTNFLRQTPYDGVSGSQFEVYTKETLYADAGLPPHGFTFRRPRIINDINQQEFYFDHTYQYGDPPLQMAAIGQVARMVDTNDIYEYDGSVWYLSDDQTQDVDIYEGHDDYIRSGDYLGPWIFNDMYACLNLLTVQHRRYLNHGLSYGVPSPDSNRSLKKTASGSGDSYSEAYQNLLDDWNSKSFDTTIQNTQDAFADAYVERHMSHSTDYPDTFDLSVTAKYVQHLVFSVQMIDAFSYLDSPSIAYYAVGDWSEPYYNNEEDNGRYTDARYYDFGTSTPDQSYKLVATNTGQLPVYTDERGNTYAYHIGPQYGLDSLPTLPPTPAHDENLSSSQSRYEFAVSDIFQSQSLPGYPDQTQYISVADYLDNNGDTRRYGGFFAIVDWTPSFKYY